MTTKSTTTTSFLFSIILASSCLLQAPAAVDHPSFNPTSDNNNNNNNKGYYHSSGYYSYDSSSSSSSSSSSDDSRSDDALSSSSNQAILLLIFGGSLIVIMFCSVLVCCFMRDRLRNNQFYKDVAKARLDVLRDAATNDTAITTQEVNNDQVVAGKDESTTTEQLRTPVINFVVGKFSSTYLPEHSLDNENNKATIDGTENTGDYEKSSGSMWFHHLIDAHSSSSAADVHYNENLDDSDKTVTASNHPTSTDGDGDGTDGSAKPSKDNSTPTAKTTGVNDDAVAGTRKVMDGSEGNAGTAAPNKNSPSNKAMSTTPSSSSSAAITITGVGKDRDGPFKIKTGKLSPYTGKCYWLEESVVRKNSPRQKKTRVLVTGIFQRDMETGVVRFTGRWQSSFGTRGSYANFDIFPNDDKQANA